MNCSERKTNVLLQMVDLQKCTVLTRLDFIFIALRCRENQKNANAAGMDCQALDFNYIVAVRHSQQSEIAMAPILGRAILLCQHLFDLVDVVG